MQKDALYIWSLTAREGPEDEEDVAQDEGGRESPERVTVCPVFFRRHVYTLVSQAMYFTKQVQMP